MKQKRLSGWISARSTAKGSSAVMASSPGGEIVLYEAAGGHVSIEVRLEHETVWLSQAQMADLFGRERSVITKHIQNVFAERELIRKSNVQNLHIANSDKPVAFYSLDADHEFFLLRVALGDEATATPIVVCCAFYRRCHGA